MLLCRMDEVGGMNNEERFYDDGTIYFGSGALLSSAHISVPPPTFCLFILSTLKVIKMAHVGLYA